MKPRFPFRLGTTSYVIPADILPNVRFLADQVDDIEILLFESRDISTIPSAEIVRELEKLAADHGLTYTVHLPIDIHTGHPEASERRRAVESASFLLWTRLGWMDSGRMGIRMKFFPILKFHYPHHSILLLK